MLKIWTFTPIRFFTFYLFIHLFMCGCSESLLLYAGFLQLLLVGATLQLQWMNSLRWFLLLLSMGSIQAPRLHSWGAWTQQLGCMGLVAPRHVESSQIRDQTHAPCVGRVLNSFTTRKSLKGFFFFHKSYSKCLIKN